MKIKLLNENEIVVLGKNKIKVSGNLTISY